MRCGLHTLCTSSAGLIKVCLAYETGLLPKNLHYHRDTPNPTSAGLKDGTLQVPSAAMPMQLMTDMVRCCIDSVEVTKTASRTEHSSFQAPAHSDMHVLESLVINGCHFT